MCHAVGSALRDRNGQHEERLHALGRLDLVSQRGHQEAEARQRGPPLPLRELLHHHASVPCRRLPQPPRGRIAAHVLRHLARLVAAPDEVHRELAVERHGAVLEDGRRRVRRIRQVGERQRSPVGVPVLRHDPEGREHAEGLRNLVQSRGSNRRGRSSRGSRPQLVLHQPQRHGVEPELGVVAYGVDPRKEPAKLGHGCSPHLFILP
mmetsp:Transcript_55390/g.161694  ORF Transcript_55390/g.161694 Transcript_55390/m.161694 type:complete len:207 (-) Transcript_55390:414-1034(-)